MTFPNNAPSNPIDNSGNASQEDSGWEELNVSQFESRFTRITDEFLRDIPKNYKSGQSIGHYTTMGEVSYPDKSRTVDSYDAKVFYNEQSSNPIFTIKVKKLAE